MEKDFSSENPNDWELSIEEKFPDYWNYFCKIFHEKPEARNMILELKFERDQERERQDRAGERKREYERMEREYRDHERRDRERRQRSRSQRSRYKRNYSFYSYYSYY